MKKLLFGFGAAGILAAGLAAPASAADLPARTYTKAPVVAPYPMLDWSGFYIGAEGGGGFGSDSLFFPAAGTSTGRFDTSGAIAGGVIGYNWQAPGSSWVFGVEGNFDWADIGGSTICPNTAFNCGTNLNEIFTGTGRIGYAWNSVLMYAKGGYAWTNDRADVFDPATGAIGDSTGRSGRDGYTLGVGLEYMFAPNWSAKVEYDYYNFGGRTVNANTPAGAFVEPITMTNYSVNAVKAGINYHFNWGSPVVARY
ncbi:MAG TPA: outer membrane beta-barrel protein [Bryobacteraceae bacterium]|nr:outer membrane beta-barrel protein [Bryobacteraceae bacterium]